MEEPKKYPVIDYGFDEQGLMGVSIMSLVEYPAIEVDFVKFSKEKVQMSNVNKERRMIFGPALIPGKFIYREHENTKEPFYARFSAPVIERSAHEFLKKNLHHNANIEHALHIAGACVVESWVKWSEEDKSNYMGFDLPIGTWFIGMKIDDDNIWQSVLSGDVKGFSIEGMFKVVTEQFMPVDDVKMFRQELENYLRDEEERLKGV